MIPARMPNVLPRLADRSVQCIVIDEDSRIAAFVPATATGRLLDRGPLALGDDADEEVGREERSEEHQLGDDEEQDPEHLGLHA